MRATIFCKHFRSMMDHDTCAAGIAFDTMKGMPFEKRPCFCKPGEQPRPGCDLLVLPTAEEIAAEYKQFEELFARTARAREAIVSHLGGPWKRVMAGSSDVIDCPCCGGKGTLVFSRSGYNGHIHASCTTEGCVAWME